MLPTVFPFRQANAELDGESGYESLHDDDSASEDAESLWVEKFRPKSYLQVANLHFSRGEKFCQLQK
jgi:hypothetical protein